MQVDTVHCMDAVEGINNMPDESVDLIITDPPYDVNYRDKSKHLEAFGKPRAKQIKRDQSYHNFSIDYAKYAQEMFRVLKPDTHIYIFLRELQFPMWYDALIKAGFKFNNLLVWVKNAQSFDLTMGLKYNYKHELVIFARKGVRKLNRLGLPSVLYHKRGMVLKHPCQKPLSLISNLIENSSNKGDLVADFFMGSGTTAVAAKRKERRFIGFEKSEEYCRIANDRLQQSILLPYIYEYREGGLVV